MVNVPVLVTGASIVIGAVSFLALWAYEEYRRNQRHRYTASSNSSSPTKAPPQPSNDCVICQDPLAAPLEILPCGHIFHRACIKKWLECRMICAFCRTRIAEDVAEDYKARLNLRI